MSERRLPALPRRMRVRAVAVLLGAVALLPVGCGYQLALQPTATPAGALGVRQLPGQPQQTATVDPAAILGQIAQAAPALVAAVQQAPAAPSSSSAAAAGTAAPAQSAPARPALAANEPITANAASSGAPAPTQTPARTAPAVAPPMLSDRSATPMPSYTAAAPRASASPVQASPAAATPTRPAAVQVYLPEGNSDFMYVGATLPLDRALAALAGNYTAIIFRPAGSAEQVIYRPGLDPVPSLPANTLVHIAMKKAMTLVMQPQ